MGGSIRSGRVREAATIRPSFKTIDSIRLNARASRKRSIRGEQVSSSRLAALQLHNALAHLTGESLLTSFRFRVRAAKPLY